MNEAQVKAFVEEYKGLIRNAANEAEVRSRFETAAISKLGIRDLKLEQGRQDVRRNHVIIEFKDKGLFRGRKESTAFKQAIDQLTTKYIPNQAEQDRRDVSDYTGICFDGIDLAFIYLEGDGKTRISDLRPFDVYSGGALVLALENDQRIELTSQNVANNFGPTSVVAQSMLHALWEHLDISLSSNVNRIEMLFGEWKDLFEQSTNLGQIGCTHLNTYLTSIGLPANADPTQVLFILHTYHALFFKLLAAEVVLANRLLDGIPADYCFGASALHDIDLLVSLERNIEESKLFRQVNILNFVEGSFFSWYLVGASTKLTQAIRTLMQCLSLYRLNGLQLSKTRDIVKRVYQQLVPAALRHNIGEYFTPEWLVEFTLNRVEYQGHPILTNKFLDPCCGSGNFLIHAIERYKTEAQASGYEKATILKNITRYIYGFDLNPLAVLTARVNYLIAISDLIDTESAVEIPVYQADAVYSPTANRTFMTERTCVYQISTRLSTINLELPEELIQENSLFGRILEIMERSIRNQESAQIFLAAIANEPEYRDAPDHETWEPYLLDTFRKIDRLEREDWNGIWCRIVRNYFASVAIGKCHFIAGNPPWVRWSELPATYTQRIKPTCDDYEIFSEDVFFGGNELDISAMITYTVADKWLDDAVGRLSFVITQTHFQSQSSGGFRRFEVKGTPLKVLMVDDFIQVRPFIGIANKPAVLSLEKGRPTVYPVEYLRWKRSVSTAIPEDVTWEAAQAQLAYEQLEAHSLSGAGGRWSILAPERFQVLRKLDGKDPNIEGRKGIVTDLNGAYFVEIRGRGRLPNTIRISNVPSLGRQPVPSRADEIELDLIYPLIKGAENIRAFYATTSPQYAIVPNKRITADMIPNITEFAKQYPGALRYFRAINIGVPGKAGGLLNERSTWKTRMKPLFERRIQQGKMDLADLPFYAIYDVGDYTFSPYKVVWAEMAGSIQAALIADMEMPYNGGRKPIIPDHKVYYASFDDLDYAHYVCALLNSEPVRTFIDSFTIKIQVGTLFRHIVLPTYNANDPEHKELASVSKEAHELLAATKGEASISDQQSAIDQLANNVLSLAMPIF